METKVNDKYYIKISKSVYILTLVTTIIITVLSLGILFFTLIIPICYHFIIKNCEYYYDNENLIVKKGVFNKKQYIIPLYRIINIKAEENFLKYGNIYIFDKEQNIILPYVNAPRKEMIKLSEYWQNAKNKNIRNEVI